MKMYNGIIKWPSLAIIMLASLLSVSSYADIPPLLDRELFFGDPEISGGQLSPDGEFLSFMRPYEGTRNIWVKKREAGFEEAIPVTNRTDRPIPAYFWSRDGKYILFVMDQGGDENYNIHVLDPAEASTGVIPEARNITDMEGVRAMIFHISHQDPDLLYVGLNQRDASWHDLYQLRISTGELTMLRENTNRYTSWVFDWDDQLRLASRSTEQGDNELWRMDPNGQETLIYEWTLMETAYPSGFHKENEAFFLVSNKGELDKSKLFLMDINTLDISHIDEDPEGRVDFGGLWQSQKTREIIATFYVDDQTRAYFHNKEFERHYNHLKSQLDNAEISFASGTKDETMYMVTANSDTKPSSVYLYELDDMSLTFQYTPRSGLPEKYMSPMIPVHYPSSDGLEIPGYLTMPNGYEKENLPLVVVPHGGPWARDRWGFNTYAQFFANRGYAVLQPNFRGSTGYGKAFLSAGNKEWGDLMQDDITWGVKYLIEKGVADPDRVAVFGGSYGGYATLAGLAFTPDLYAAGVSFVGPSNLITLLNSIPPYWEAARKVFHERMGDPSIPEGEKQLIRQSPLFSADQITAPLMVVQGQNDPRVVKAESDQIVIALRDRGFPVEYLNAPDEGHGFARPVNNMAFVAAMEKFLARHIGGRYQEDMPEDVAQRLKEITVDISTVALQEIPDPEASGSAPVPERELTPGTYSYEIEVMGMQMKSTTEISRNGNEIVIEEKTQTPMGAASDKVKLDASTMAPLSREMSQGPMYVNVEYKDGLVEGKLNTGQAEMPVNIELSGPLFAEGPAQYLMLATLPLSEGYSTFFLNADITNMKEKLYKMSVTGETGENGKETWRMEVTAADGSPGSLTIWAEKDTYDVIKYEMAVPQLGGATIVGKLVR